jgi:hypothetical protein
MAKVVIPLFYHLDRRIWTDSLTATTELTQIEIGQNNSIDFAVRFCNAGVATQLTSPSPVWICAIKAINDFAGVNLLLTTTGVLVGTGSTSVYTFTLLIDSSELRAWLLTVTGITALASFEIRDTNNNIATLPALTCSILPDYTLVGTTPTSASGTLVVASGKTFTVSQTLAMPTDNGTAGFVLRTDGAGVGTWVANTLGSVTSVAQSFTGGIVSVGGSPVTTSGTLALTVAGTAGGIVYFAGSATWASTGALSQGGILLGGGTGIPTVLAAVQSGRVLTSMGTLTTPAYSSTITLGASGTLGTITLGNATSGTILITPPTGALGTVTLTLPITTTTLAGLAVTQTFTQVNTFSSSTASTSTTSGAVVVTGGLGVGGNAYVGGVINLPATTSTAGQITQAGTRILHTYGTSGNFFAGPSAGNLTSSGTGHNCGVGYGSLASLGSSNGYNTGLGSYSLNGVTTGSGNMGIGYGAAGGQNCSNNTAIGYQSLNNNSGGGNTAVGFNTGQTGAEIGGLTAVIITTGSNNTLLGNGAGITLASGTYRTAIGSGSRCQFDNAIKLGRDTLDKVIIPSWAAEPTTNLSAGMLYYDTVLAKLRVYTTVWETITSV